MGSENIWIVGAAPDTGNLGVSALCYSVLAALSRRRPEATITVLDCGRGARRAEATCAGAPTEFTLLGAYNTRRLYRAESLWLIRWCVRGGGLGNEAATRFRRANAILDVSGGDSFTDLYGPRRFSAVTSMKLLALGQGIPLILLPQTYGPFRSKRTRGIAERILRGATGAWARDARSFEHMKELLGSDFDADRHRCGVDVAFLLEPVQPRRALPSPVAEWLDDRKTPVIGLNISGLLMNRPGATEQYGFRADYEGVISGLARRILDRADARLVLVPHVHGPLDGYETDLTACNRIAAGLADRSNGRLAVLPSWFDQSESKAIIARMDWFCGTRMHSTIAALSSGVPTAGIAYSLKTKGVFETCAQGGHVVDPRELATEDVVDGLWRSWEGRNAAKQSLALALPAVLAQAERQMDTIAASSRGAMPVARRQSA